MVKTCIYCGTPVEKVAGHPTWMLCPKCEPQPSQVAWKPDTRGRPSRPGGR